VFIAPGIESWNAYGQKAGTGIAIAAEKFARIVAHFEIITKFVSGLQANFMFGTDADSGRNPVDLTISFINHFPNIFPGLAFPIAFGGTPMRAKLRAEGRLLALPPIFYINPLPTLRIKNYLTSEFFTYLISIFQAAVTPEMQFRRWLAPLPMAVRLSFFVRSLEILGYIHQLQAFLKELSANKELQQFNDGTSTIVPAYYYSLLDRRLGQYARLLTRAEMQWLTTD
jgi:hypothetical protein